jgi:hypothetical protein
MPDDVRVGGEGESLDGKTGVSSMLTTIQAADIIKAAAKATSNAK